MYQIIYTSNLRIQFFFYKLSNLFTMKTLFKFSILLLSVIGFTYCSNGSGRSDYAVSEMSAVALNKPTSEQPEVAAPDTVPNATQEYERKLTKTGDLRFRTSDALKTKELIKRSVSEMKGYISNESSSLIDNQNQYTVIIRVPSQNFDKLLEKISASASRIDSKNIYVEDVTQQYIDLDKRLKTKKELEARYIQLLQKATKVEEVLKIEEQIGNLRADIESTEGQLRYLTNQVNLSTLTVTFYESNVNSGFWYKLGQAFKNGWSNILWVFVGLANLWAIILFGVIIYFIIRYFHKRRKAKKL